MSANSKLPISVDKHSGDNSVNPDMFINEIDTWIAFNGATANQQQVMALHLTGAAKEWYYNEFAKLPAAQQSYDELKNKLRARFRRGDENIIARREQHTLRNFCTFTMLFLVLSIQLRAITLKATRLFAVEACKLAHITLLLHN